MRQRQVQRVAAQLRRREGHSGVVVVGGAGVGKTTLARNALRAARGPVRWVAASETARGIPLGAFAHLVDASGESEPHTIVRAARERLLSEPNVVIGVDDAHMLDELSATVVHQLAIEHAASFVVTVRTGTEIPDAVTALWKDDLLARVDLTAFTRDEVAAVVEAALGGPVESVSIDRLYRTSQGNPLYLRHLVEGAVATEHLRRVAGVWQLRGAHRDHPATVCAGLRATRRPARTCPRRRVRCSRSAAPSTSTRWPRCGIAERSRRPSAPGSSASAARPTD